MCPSWTAGQTVQLLNSKEADLKYLLLAFARSHSLLWMRAIPHPWWSVIPIKLVNAKMQLAKVRHSPGFCPVTSSSLRLSERCGCATTPDQRCAVNRVLGAQKSSGTGSESSLAVRNKCLFVWKNSWKHRTSSPNQGFVRLSQHFVSRLLQAA